MGLNFFLRQKSKYQPPRLSYNSNFQYSEIIHQYDSRFQISTRYLNYLISEFKILKLILLSSCSILIQKYSESKHSTLFLLFSSLISLLSFPIPILFTEFQLKKNSNIFRHNGGWCCWLSILGERSWKTMQTLWIA